MVSTFYPPYSFGGDGMHIYRLSNELAKRGHSVDVFHCEDAYLLVNGEEPTGEFYNEPGVNVYGLKSRAGLLSPLLTQQTGRPFFKKDLKSALEGGDYDVIHFNNMSLIGISAVSYGSPDSIRLYTTHEHWLICPMHVLWKYDREVCTRKTCFRCQLKGKRPPQLWRRGKFFRRNLERIDRFLSPSRFTLRKHIEDGLDIPIVHMPYFLPPYVEDEAVESGSNDRSAKPYFLFVGRLEKIKGLQNVIPLFRRRKDFELLIAGDGEYGEELKEQASGSENIKFLGRVDQARLRDLYTCAAAVIVPSICYETFGIIIIEAFSRKTPVIVNDLGALPEVVEDSDGGFIFRNEKELETAVEKLARDPGLRRRLGNNGYQAYREYWDTEAHLERYLGLIDDVRKEKSGEGAQNRMSARSAPVEASQAL